MSKLPEITLKEIAHRLKQKKENKEPPTLFLGSRTGWFYKHEKFYEEIKPFSNVATAFDTYTDIEKFQECYSGLKSKRFNSGSIEDLLRSRLDRSVQPRNADICMAEMIFGGYFDVVISTTIDSLLQAGLNHQRSLEEVVAFNNELLILHVHPLDHILREERRVNKTIKIFGDLETSMHYHTVQHELNLDDEKNVDLKGYLRRSLARPTIVIGFDPIWDNPMVKAFSNSGRDIIYINEEELDEECEMARVITARDGRCLIGKEWNYAGLMDILHEELFLQRPLSIALARTLSKQLALVQESIAEVKQQNREHADRVEHLLHLLQTFQGDMQALHENTVWLQDAVQQLLNTQKL
ncbi:MAG: hypothetical protein ACRDHZ_25835, partial [Ktedonobacteraceae bacterium]